MRAITCQGHIRDTSARCKVSAHLRKLGLRPGLGRHVDGLQILVDGVGEVSHPSPQSFLADAGSISGRLDGPSLAHEV